MDLDEYNRSFQEVVETFDEEIDERFQSIRQQCVKDFIDSLNKRQQDWDSTFRELLAKSQEIDQISRPLLVNKHGGDFSGPQKDLFSGFIPSQSEQKADTVDCVKENQKPPTVSLEKPSITSETKKSEATIQAVKAPPKSEPELEPKTQDQENEFDDPLFSNLTLIKEFIRVQELLEQTRQSLEVFSSNPTCKAYKNELNLFIRTQINSISNSDQQHLDSKIRLLTNLFTGQRVSFQDRLIDATQHPQGQLFCMDTAAQTFVTVGTRLVNSVPAIAKSMASVINGVVSNDLPMFKDLVIGHLQERCPHLIPIHPRLTDYTDSNPSTSADPVNNSSQSHTTIKYKIACGYTYDSKNQTLESDDKYLARMRSLVLIYACVLIQGHSSQAWSWLAAFLSLRPQPVISATVLQAYLQEASKRLSSTYGHQYSKLLAFIRNHYIKLVEEITPKTSDRQSFIKLKNLLADNSNLIAAPKISSIFAPIRYA